MAKNKYPHFDPSKHNVDVKMAKVRSSSHCKHNINYHIDNIICKGKRSCEYCIQFRKIAKSLMEGNYEKEITK